MKTFAANIYEVIKDYRKDGSFQITIPHILEWATQFDADAELMLQELNEILIFSLGAIFPILAP
jgi:hypothetical protein